MKFSQKISKVLKLHELYLFSVTLLVYTLPPVLTRNKNVRVLQLILVNRLFRHKVLIANNTKYVLQ